MEIDAAKVIAALEASRKSLPAPAPTRGDKVDAFVLSRSPWMTGSMSKFAVPATLSVPSVAGSNWWWFAVAPFVAAHVAFVDRRAGAAERRAQAQKQQPLPQLREMLERVLTDARRAVLAGTTCRLTILLPRKVTASEWQLVPAIRSGGLPIENARPLRVVQNKLEDCEGVSGQVFGSDADAFQEASWDPKDVPEYCKRMCVSEHFLSTTDVLREERRTPLYVLAIMLRFNRNRMGVLAIDNDRDQHLLSDAPGSKREDLTKAQATEHVLRRSKLEAIAGVLPQLVVASLYEACGVRT